MKNFLILLLLLIATTAQAQFTAFSPPAVPPGTLDNKGDLLTHDGVTDKVFSVGADGTILVADSGAANGMDWKTNTFLLSGDTPVTYAGQTLKAVRVNAGETALEFYDIVVPTSDFLSLTDVPASYAGASLQSVRVNVGETALEFFTAISAFTGLDDVPSSYVGESLKAVRVNLGETALEFYTLIAGDMSGPISATDEAIVIYDGVTGKLVKNSKVTIDADGRMAQPDLGDATYFGVLAGGLDDLSANANTGYGYDALGKVVTGTRNAAFGRNTLRKTTGTSNSAFGAHAGSSMLNSSRNSLLGDAAGFSIMTGGDDNTLLGYAAGNSITTGDFNIILGSGKQPPTGTTSNWLNIGDVIESDMTTGKILMDTINLVGLPVHADEAAASALTTGDVYQTVTGELRIKL